MVVLLVSLLAWTRERRLRLQRKDCGRPISWEKRCWVVVLGIHPETPWRVIAGHSRVSRIRLYVFNRASKTLESVAAEDMEAASISLSAPAGAAQSGAVACFHYRTLLMIPDITRSPFPSAGHSEGPTKSLLFVPMLAQGEVVGVLELDQDDRMRVFTTDEQELAQHLGNQTGVAVRLLDRRLVQEQLFRTESLPPWDA